MVKSIKKVVKVSPTRERRKIIIVGTEGNNKTEEIYLRSLEKKQSRYHFIFADGNDTDAVNIVNNTIKKARTEGISNRNGDFAVSIFDLDIEKSKEKLYLKAKVIADSKNVMLITSNPCFEIWFLEHFCFTTKPFNGSSNLIKELKKYIPDYSKNLSVFDVLYPRLKVALVNCERLDKHHLANRGDRQLQFCNPQTEVYKLVKLLSLTRLG